MRRVLWPRYLLQMERRYRSGVTGCCSTEAVCCCVGVVRTLRLLGVSPFGHALQFVTDVYSLKIRNSGCWVAVMDLFVTAIDVGLSFLLWRINVCQCYRKDL